MEIIHGKAILMSVFKTNENMVRYTKIERLEKFQKTESTIP